MKKLLFLQNASIIAWEHSMILKSCDNKNMGGHHGFIFRF